MRDDDSKNLNEMAGVRCATALISLRFLISSSLTLIRVQFVVAAKQFGLFHEIWKESLFRGRGFMDKEGKRGWGPFTNDVS